jgi:glycosyltransferase involved in cell wall biosynthesis
MINILFVGTVCSEKLISSMLDKKLGLPHLAAQKFYRLLFQGIALNSELFNLKVLASPDYVKSVDGNIVIFKKSELENKVYFSYTPIILIPILKRFVIIYFLFINISKWLFYSKYKKNVLVFDILNLSSSITCFIMSKLFNIKSIAIVTDLPSLLYSPPKKKIFNILFIKTINFILNHSDGYIFLTDSMNLKINKKNKPFCIIEGVADIQLLKKKSTVKNRNENLKIIHYSGGLYENYGVKALIEAFMLIKKTEIRLHLFGNGDLIEFINLCALKDNRIVYWGYKENKEILADQLNSIILLNPRFTNEEYTKYSFPSKTIEYMASGIPLLTTKLPGIPVEYFDYFYTFDEESINGYKVSLEKILNKPKDELILFGQKSKKFVLNFKNNHIQTKKIYNICNKL